MIRLLIIIGLAAVNFTALAVFIYTLHKFIASGPDDLGGASALLGAVLASVPIIHGARLLTNKIQLAHWRARSHTGMLLGLNLIAVLGVLCLWQFALPWTSQYHYRQGIEFYQAGKLNLATEHLNRSIYQQLDNPAALRSLATLYEDIKDDEKAEQFYSLAIRHEAAPFTSLNNLARLYLKNGEHDEAIALLLRAQTHLWRTAQPDDDRLNLRQGVIAKNLAWAYWLAQDTTLATQTLTDASATLELAGAITSYPEIQCLRAILLTHPQANEQVNACERGLAEKEVNSLDIGLLREARKQHAE